MAAACSRILDIFVLESASFRDGLFLGSASDSPAYFLKSSPSSSTFSRLFPNSETETEAFSCDELLVLNFVFFLSICLFSVLLLLEDDDVALGKSEGWLRPLIFSLVASCL